MNITFQGSHAGVTAESIGAPPPVCAPKAVPVVDSFGNWQCQTAGTSGGGTNTLLLILLAAAAYWWFVMRPKSRTSQAVHATHTAPVRSNEL